MTEETRPIRCHFGRVDPEPCMEPATVEMLDPVPTMLCAEHAQQRLADLPGPAWWRYSADDAAQYARWCEETVDALRAQIPGWGSKPPGPVNHVFYGVIEEAATYLECYELPRVRAELVKSGGTPKPTGKELSMLDFYRQSAQEYGWTDKPPWVERMERWIARLERENEGSRA